MAIFNWLKQSNRWKHLAGGAVLGVLSNGFYCAALTGGATGAAMEYKDHKHGDGWDWIDLALTAAGAIAGYAVKYLILA